MFVGTLEEVTRKINDLPFISSSKVWTPLDLFTDTSNGAFFSSTNDETPKIEARK